MLLRQIQADPLPRHRLRPLRCRGDGEEGPPRAHGSYHPDRSGGPHLVLQERPEQDQRPARRPFEEARVRDLLREVHRHQPGYERVREVRPPVRGRVPDRDGPFPGELHPRRRRSPEVRRQDGCRRYLRPPERDRRRGPGQVPAPADAHRDFPAAEDRHPQAPVRREVVPGVQGHQPPRVDDHEGPAGDSAGAPPARPAGRRPLRHLRPE